MITQIVETATLFTDDFNSTLNTANWDYNKWEYGGSFYGRTQQRQSLPVVSNGQLHLELDTYNPTNGSVPSFYGSEAMTTATFSNETGGVSFEIKAHFENTVVAGIVGGMFSYHTNPGGLHDEIDFEAVSNRPNQIQTNVYANEPLGAGHPAFDQISGALTDEHTYRMEWFQNAVCWYVDGQLVRVDRSNIPQNSMALGLNIWAPADDWAEAFSGALNPVTNASANTSYFFDIDSVHVARLSSTNYFPLTPMLRNGISVMPEDYTGPAKGAGGTTLHFQYLGDSSGEVLIGTVYNDFINSGAGVDAVDAKEGNDVIDGGTGSNFLTGGAGTDIFFSDGRGGVTTWSTITDWQAGEQLSVWGWTPGTSKIIAWVQAGAAGYEGLTMHADLNGDGAIDTSVTFTGITSQSQLPTPLEFDGVLWFT
jgi:hypothetical protein